jgi:multidrug resistance efflux pump
MNPSSLAGATSGEPLPAVCPRRTCGAARHAAFLAVALLFLAGCDREKGKAGAGPAAAEAPKPITNRIDIPAAVRQNLGITFAKAQSRRVAATRRYPGRFELLPQARQQYHAPLPGRVELLVAQYQAVKAGEVLFRIDAPQWRELQEKLAGEVVAIQLAQRRIDANADRAKAIGEHGKAVAAMSELWKKRLDDVTKLMAAGGGGATELAEARARLADAVLEDAKVHEEIAELTESRIQLESDLARFRQVMPLLFAQAREQPADPAKPAPFDVTMARVASITGYSVEDLMKTESAAALPRWRTIDRIEVKAARDGLVEVTGLTGGAWADSGAVVLTIVDPAAVRFRAVLPQSDLPLLRDGLTGSILPPRAGGTGDGAGVAATIALGLEADAQQRTMEVIATPQTSVRPAWARAGVSSQLEVVIDGGAKEELAIPVSAVIQDGLVHVFFRRDPRDPDKVIRLEGDLGISDGQWVVVNSGIREGDEIVLQGVYELKLASSTSGQAKGGHFHADGTWHADGTPEPGGK